MHFNDQRQLNWKTLSTGLLNKIPPVHPLQFLTKQDTQRYLADIRTEAAKGLQRQLTFQVSDNQNKINRSNTHKFTDVTRKGSTGQLSKTPRHVTVNYRTGQVKKEDQIQEANESYLDSNKSKVDSPSKPQLQEELPIK